jgi:hypothetical protein
MYLCYLYRHSFGNNHRQLLSAACVFVHNDNDKENDDNNNNKKNSCSKSTLLCSAVRDSSGRELVMHGRANFENDCLCPTVSLSLTQSQSQNVQSEKLFKSMVTSLDSHCVLVK